MMETYCENCNDFVTYEIYDIELSTVLHGKNIKYRGKKAICCECGKEVWVKEIHDDNLLALNTAYRESRKSKDIISNEQIMQLLDMYNIGKGPLAKLLGWSEVTIVRYLDNSTIPSPQYSYQLKKLFDPAYMKQLLNERGENLTPVAFKKSISSVENLLSKSTYCHLDENDEVSTDVEDYFRYALSNIELSQKQKLIKYLNQHKLEMDDFLNSAIDYICGSI